MFFGLIAPFCLYPRLSLYICFLLPRYPAQNSLSRPTLLLSHTTNMYLAFWTFRAPCLVTLFFLAAPPLLTLPYHTIFFCFGGRCCLFLSFYGRVASPNVPHLLSLVYPYLLLNLLPSPDMLKDGSARREGQQPRRGLDQLAGGACNTKARAQGIAARVPVNAALLFVYICFCSWLFSASALNSVAI